MVTIRESNPEPSFQPHLISTSLHSHHTSRTQSRQAGPSTHFMEIQLHQLQLFQHHRHTCETRPRIVTQPSTHPHTKYPRNNHSSYTSPPSPRHHAVSTEAQALRGRQSARWRPPAQRERLRGVPACAHRTRGTPCLLQDVLSSQYSPCPGACLSRLRR